MANANRHSAPDRRELRNFGLLTGALTVGIFGLLLPLIRRHPLPSWPLIAAVALIVPAIVWPSALRYPHLVWTRIGIVLGWINSRIILTILFFVVIMPMGLIMRAMGRDPVSRKLEPEAESYRVPSRPRTRESMDRPF